MSEGAPTLLRVADVLARTGLGRTTLYRRMEAGTFPHSIQIGRHRVRWRESDIDQWVANPMVWRADAAPAAQEGN